MLSISLIATGLQVTVYFESPGPVAAKIGLGLEMTPDLHRYLVATQAEVDADGGYEVYGERRLPDGYLFVGVESKANNELQI